MFECTECFWEGGEDELDNGYCPCCGADVEEIEEADREYVLPDLIAA